MFSDVPYYENCAWHQHTLILPWQSPGMGKGLADGVQPFQVWGHHLYTENWTRKGKVQRPWHYPRDCYFCQVPWSPHQQQTHMERLHWYHNKESISDPQPYQKKLLELPNPCPWAVLQNTCETLALVRIISMGQQCQTQHQQSRIGLEERCTFYLSIFGFWITDDLLQKLQWDSLQQWWSRSRVLMYRIWSGLIAVPTAAYLEPVPICTRRLETRYVQIQCNTVGIVELCDYARA